MQPVRCLELGTCLGITAAYIGQALQLNGSGDLVSVEGCPALAQIAIVNLQQLGLGNVSVRTGRFVDVLGELCANTTFDFAWVDGHHDYDATLRYFEQIASSGTDDMMIVIDDIYWSVGMRSAWASIRNSSKVTTSVTVGSFGLCFTSPNSLS
jgi:predicted O-methyltransferase YrrM